MVKRPGEKNGQECGNVLPSPLPGFERIKRYWDPRNKKAAAKILPGEYYVTNQDEVITTVLGSCVSACIRDRLSGIGGMNHFMLPLSANGEWAGGSDPTSTATRYGNYAMEHMINDILKLGGQRKNLEIKIFGGGRMYSSGSDVGRNNITFVRDYLRTERLEVVSENVGDIYPRKIVYYPASGRVRMKKLKQMHNTEILRREKRYKEEIEKAPVAGDIELF